MRKDLDDEGLGQNKVLYSSLGVKLPMINYYACSLTLFALGRQISGYPPASGSRTALTRIPPSCLFLVPSFGTFFNTFRWSPLFPLCRELDCWLGYGWSGINERRRCCWLVGVFVIELVEQPLKVLYRGGRFLGILFLHISFP